MTLRRAGCWRRGKDGREASPRSFLHTVLCSLSFYSSLRSVWEALLPASGGGVWGSPRLLTRRAHLTGKDHSEEMMTVTNLMRPDALEHGNLIYALDSPGPWSP